MAHYHNLLVLLDYANIKGDYELFNLVAKRIKQIDSNLPLWNRRSQYGNYCSILTIQK